MAEIAKLMVNKHRAIFSMPRVVEVENEEHLLVYKLYVDGINAQE